MEHMVAGLMVGASQMEMTWSEMEGSWIHLIYEEVDMDFTLGVTWDIL